MKESTTLTSKGQVTIPKQIREALNLKPGDKVIFEKEGSKVVLKSPKTLLDFRGYVKGEKTYFDCRRQNNSQEENRKEDKRGTEKVTEIFMDTNTFIRYFTNDIPEHAEKIAKLLKRARKGEIKLITHEIIVAEIVWVLESAYEMKKEDVYELVQAMLNTRNLEIPNKSLLKETIEVYKDKNIDFTDAYTASYMRAKGFRKLCSFDKKHMRRIDWIELQEP